MASLMRVVVGICADSGKLLMGKRRPNDGFYGGHWEFPGGKVEAGESDIDALKREFQEELGADIEGDPEFVHKFVWNYPNRDVELNFYLIQLKQKKIEEFKMNCHTELGWYTKDEALQLKLLPANFELIRDLPV